MKDVGEIHDAIFYLQNLIALEHHALESFASTKNETFIQIAEECRKKRSKIMYSMIKESKDQRYCMSKHALACAMACKELGNRKQTDKKYIESKEYFDDSAFFEALFILINEK
jgi:hypothetical protein